MVETYLLLASPFAVLIVFAAGANWIIKRIDKLDNQKNNETL